MHRNICSALEDLNFPNCPPHESDEVGLRGCNAAHLDYQQAEIVVAVRRDL